MNVRYYDKPEDVIFRSPVIRLLVKIFGPNRFVYRCKTCGKIPADLYEGHCLLHKKSDQTCICMENTKNGKLISGYCSIHNTDWL